MVILDTDHFSLWERATSLDAERMIARLERLASHERSTTIITYEEQTRGWLAYAAQARTVVQEVAAYRKLKGHLDAYLAFLVLEFDERAATEYQRLRQSRVHIGTMDLKIAAIALANDATLLSRNLADFHKVPGLKVEDWTI